jgi:hypothetical protein
MTTASRLTPRLSSTSPALMGPEQVTVENAFALLKIKGPSRGSGIVLNSTCMRKRRASSRRQHQVIATRNDPCSTLVSGPEGDASPLSVLGYGPIPRPGRHLPMASDTTPRRYASVNGGDQMRARALDPAPVVHTPGDSWATGTKNTCSTARAR